MGSQKSYFLAQLRSLAAPTPSSAAFPSSEETASHPDWLRTFTILRLNDIGLTPDQHKKGLRNGLREFNNAIPATSVKEVRMKNSRITNLAADQPFPSSSPRSFEERRG
jgi:hypothetical protein